MKIYNYELINSWMDNCKDMTVDELENEIVESKVAISNEELWRKGSTSEEGILRHTQNIIDLSEYISRLRNRVQETIIKKEVVNE